MIKRSLEALRIVFSGLAAAFRDPRTNGLLAVTATLVVIASVFYRLVEGWGILDAMFFSVATISTVGYGDLVPETGLGQVFTIVFIFVGIGLFVATAASIADHVIRRGRADAEKSESRDRT